MKKFDSCRRRYEWNQNAVHNSATSRSHTCWHGNRTRTVSQSFTPHSPEYSGLLTAEDVLGIAKDWRKRTRKPRCGNYTGCLVLIWSTVSWLRHITLTNQRLSLSRCFGLSDVTLSPCTSFKWGNLLNLHILGANAFTDFAKRYTWGSTAGKNDSICGNGHVFAAVSSAWVVLSLWTTMEVKHSVLLLVPCS